MSKSKNTQLSDWLHWLRYGSVDEQIQAAKFLGDSGDVQGLPALRRALKRLREPEPNETTGEDSLFHDPDKELRLAILDAIAKLTSDTD